MSNSVFKQCTSCSGSWRSLEDFLNDDMISFVGYQAFVEDGILGMYLFNHEPCETTLALSADKLTHLSEGVLYRSEHPLPHHPHPYCLMAEDGSECPPECECAAVQQTIDTILDTVAGRDTPSG